MKVALADVEQAIKQATASKPMWYERSSRLTVSVQQNMVCTYVYVNSVCVSCIWSYGIILSDDKMAFQIIGQQIEYALKNRNVKFFLS